MTTNSSSRISIPGPFQNPSVPTIADAQARIDADESLPRERRRRVRSSLNLMAKAAGGSPEQISADFDVLRRRTAGFHPKHADVSLKRWQNARSETAFAFRHLGLPKAAGRYLAPFRPAWQALWDAITDPQLRWALSRLFHYASALGIDPADVTDETLRGMQAAMIQESLLRNPERTVRRTATVWNRAARTVPGWPATLLTVVDRRTRYTIPLGRFPETFQNDVEAFLDRVGSNNPFRNDGPPRPFAEVTLRHRKDQIRRLASALVLSGTPIENVRSLAYLVTPERLQRALTFMWERNGEEKSGNIHGLATAMLSIARHHVRVDADMLQELQSLCAQANLQQVGLTAKNMERLRQFRDPRNTKALLDLPALLQSEALRRGQLDEKAAVLMQSAVAVELLLMCMLRRRNLVNLDEARHLKWSRAGRRGICHIAVEPAEVKNRERLEFELPPRSAALLRLYLDRYQPLLGTTPTSLLFPGRYGKAKNAAGLSAQVADTVFGLTGVKVHVHLFRHIGAMLYLERNPGGYEVLRRTFGHPSLRTTIAAYCGLEMVAAAKHFDAEILAHGDARNSRPPRRSTGRRRPTKQGGPR
jgi:integrase